MAWDAAHYSKAVQDLKTGYSCLEKVLAMLKDQKKLLESSMNRLVSDEDHSAANANIGIIKRKIIECQRNLEKSSEMLNAARQKEDRSARRETQAGARRKQSASSPRVQAVPSEACRSRKCGQCTPERVDVYPRPVELRVAGPLRFIVH